MGGGGALKRGIRIPYAAAVWQLCTPLVLLTSSLLDTPPSPATAISLPTLCLPFSPPHPPPGNAIEEAVGATVSVLEEVVRASFSVFEEAVGVGAVPLPLLARAATTFPNEDRDRFTL